MSKLADTRTKSGSAAATDPTTDRILDAALHLMASRVPANMTVDEIARQAEVARVTIYRRFQGRDAIIRALTEREAYRLFTQLETALSDTPDPEDRIVEGFVATMRTAMAHPLVAHVLGSDPDSVLPVFAASGTTMLTLGRSYLVARLMHGRSDAVEVAEVVVRLVISLLSRRETDIPLETDDDMRRFARRYILPIVYPRPEAEA